MIETFKAGDKVYFPERFTNIVTLEEHLDPQYPVSIMGTSVFDKFTIQGLSNVESILPSIFHATEENHRKLSELYGIKFEEPAKVKSSREIIQAMLDDDWKYVPCYLSDVFQYPDSSRYKALVKELNSKMRFVEIDGSRWEYATPFDLRTGKPIIDYVNGQIITE